MSRPMYEPRAWVLIAVAAGAVGSVALMLYAGRSAPAQLIVPFAIWVLSPFVLLWWANVASKDWSATTRAALYSVTLVVTVGSLIIYAARALRPPKAQGAFVFVAVPPASWLLIATAISIAALISRRLSRPEDRA